MKEVLSGSKKDVSGGERESGGGKMKVSNPLKPIADVLPSSLKDITKDYSERPLKLDVPAVATEKRIR